MSSFLCPSENCPPSVPPSFLRFSLPIRSTGRPWIESRVATPSLSSSSSFHDNCFLRFVGFRDRTTCRVLIVRQLRDAGSPLPSVPVQFCSCQLITRTLFHGLGVYEEVTFPPERRPTFLGTNGWVDEPPPLSRSFWPLRMPTALARRAAAVHRHSRFQRPSHGRHGGTD